MTNRMETQVRNYTEFFVSTVEPVALDDITQRPLGIGDGPVRPIRPLPASNQRRGWLVAAISATVVLALLGGVAVFFDQTELDPLAGDSRAVDSIRVLPFVTGLEQPSDVAFDASGAMVISEHFGGTVSRVEILSDGTAGESVVIAGSYFEDLERLAVDEDGVVYFSNNSDVFRVSDEIAPIEWLSGKFAGGFVGAEGLAVDVGGDLYVADSAESGVRISRVAVVDGQPTTTEVLVVPGGGMAGDIVLGSNGELVVISLDEIWEVTFTEDGSPMSLRIIASVPGEPRTVAFDSTGTLHVGTSVGTVWSIGPSGNSTLVATGFDNVEAMAFDASGVLYLVEGNRVVRVLLPRT